MLNRIRDRFGTAGLVVSIMALVLALGGGAFAASGGLNAKQKKQVKAIAKTFAGKPGAAGAVGPAGPAGAKGDQGLKGDQGFKGDKGDKGDTGDQGTFSTEPLPPGETLTGYWAGQMDELKEITVAISYPIRIDPAPSSELIPFGPAMTQAVVVNPETGETIDFLNSEAAVDTYCPGSVTDPKARPGTLCIYPGAQIEGGQISFDTPIFASSNSNTGQPIPLRDSTAGSGGYADGTWAVTAAE
jgi:hypothetical protein